MPDQKIVEIKNKVKQLDTFKDYNIDQLVDDSKVIAKILVENEMSTSSIRNVHEEIVKISALFKIDTEKALRRLRILKPKISYMRAKAKKYQRPAFENFEEVMIPSINKINSKEDFIAFRDFYDSVLMYHKAQGGR